MKKQICNILREAINKIEALPEHSKLKTTEHNGLLWADTIKDENGNAQSFTHQEALDYAESINARLPTIEELLHAYLTGLKFDEPRFWSGTAHPDFPANAYVFVGYSGSVSYGNRSFSNSIRCVLPSSP